MTDLLHSGHVVDFVLGVLILESAALSFLRRGFEGSAKNIFVAALPGVFLLLALRSSLTGADGNWTLFWLALSFPAHLGDLWRRPV